MELMDYAILSSKRTLSKLQSEVQTVYQIKYVT